MQYINRLDTLNLIVPRNQFHQLISKENGYLKRMVIIEARLAWPILKFHQLTIKEIKISLTTDPYDAAKKNPIRSDQDSYQSPLY
jgi:hypothetical protein